MARGPTGWARAADAAFTFSQAPASKRVSFSKPNGRPRPGARPSAISAASMRIVPAPHMGSRSGWSGVHPASRSSPAARFFLSGASPVLSRRPRLKSGSPLVSR